MWSSQHRPFLPVRRRLASPGPFASQVQAFFPVNAVSPLVIVSPAFPPQQDLDPLEAVPYSRLGDLPDPLPHCPIVPLMIDVAKHRSREHYHRTGSALGNPIGRQQTARQLFPLSTS